MKRIIFSILSLAAAGSASAQGLLNIVPTQAEAASSPWTFGVTANVGWDSNINSTKEAVDSMYVGGNVSGAYAYSTESSVFRLYANAGMNYYFDQIDGLDKDRYNLRIGTQLTHAFTDRLSIDWKLYLGYQYEPNYIRGASVARNMRQYFYGDTDLTINYLISDRWTSGTSFSIYGIDYDDDGGVVGAVGTNREDRISYGFRQLFRYALNDQTGLRTEYRYSYTDYDSGITSDTHSLLVGADYAMDDNTMLLFMVGASYYDNDLRGSSTKPYLELGITRSLTDVMSVRWTNRLGYEDTGIGIYTGNYSYRTNLDFNYQLSEKLGSYAGLTYIYTDYDGNPGNTENLFQGRVGLDYAFTQLISLGLNYHYTNLSSDFDFNEYDRHRIDLGVTATF